MDNIQQIATSIIPRDELTAAIYIILLTVGITHSAKFIIKNALNWNKAKRHKALYGIALLVGGLLACVMWPEGSVAPWWAVAWALGPVSNLLFWAGMKPIKIFFPKVAAALNLDKTKKR